VTFGAKGIFRYPSDPSQAGIQQRQTSVQGNQSDRGRRDGMIWADLAVDDEKSGKKKNRT